MGKRRRRRSGLEGSRGGGGFGGNIGGRSGKRGGNEGLDLTAGAEVVGPIGEARLEAL